MLQKSKQPSLIKMLVLLTCLSIFTQILFLWVNSLTSNILDSMLSASLTNEILHSNIVMIAFIKFILSQLLIYSIYIALVWYISVSVGELLSLRWSSTYILGIVLWLISFIAILSANMIYSPHSFFASLIRTYFFNDLLTDSQLKYTFFITTGIVSIGVILSCIHLCSSLYKKQHLLRHSTVLLFLTSILFIITASNMSARPIASSVATATKPNIIIIGLDALRPDFIGYYNGQTTHTPYIDAFLKSGIRFDNTYTTLARTFPSWTSILTGAYPRHNGARGNSTKLNTVRLDETLPKRLKEAGYETIYSTDDTRFNNTNQLFGFDHVITPPMGLNDFLIGSINDFPLSNLLIPTPIGRLLFPYNYANHGTAITYDPKNFLHLIQTQLHQREEKPLFIAVHFTITHWPFYWFNDKQSSNQHESSRYKYGIEAADKQLAGFFHILEKNKLLDHAIVLLLSDHGISLGLPGDRIVSSRRYQGNKQNIKKLAFAKYSTAPAQSLDMKRDYGVDTSYGYGGDVLSLHAYHSLLAFKGYGVSIGAAHTITDRISLIDIAPTLLDLINQPPLQESDGMSLKPYLLHPEISLNKLRPFYLETSYTIDEIEKEGISVQKVLEKSLQLYEMDPKTSLVFVNPVAEKSMNLNKEQAIIQGDWLLAHYPASERSRLSFTSNGIEKYTLPPFMVLVNLKTGKWTTELNTPFAKTAPLKSLHDQLYAFYGNELNTDGTTSLS